MNTRLNVRAIVRTYGLWAALLTVPLLVNWGVWAALVVPQQGNLRAWRDTQQLAQAKPKLEALLTESRQALMDWERTCFSASDPSAVMQAVKRLADQHHVQMKELSAQGQVRGEISPKGKTVAGFSTMPLKLAVTGRFHKLAHWIGGVESLAGLQVESWSIEPGEAAGDPHELTVDLTAFLRAS